jgi:hypothetical protein
MAIQFGSFSPLPDAGLFRSASGSRWWTSSGEHFDQRISILQWPNSLFSPHLCAVDGWPSPGTFRRLQSAKA